MTDTPKIIYTETDEAPALATYSLLPILRAFTAPTGVEFESRDISLAARILAVFPDELGDKKVHDALAELGELAKQPQANIVKLPNISASIPQLEAAIKELQGRGYDIPDYPKEPSTPDEREARARYDKIKGSAVNPVLREGNSDRRAPNAVKEFARKNPHFMGEWSKDSKSHVATMEAGDFRHNEKSVTLKKPCKVRIEHVDQSGQITVLKPEFPLLEGEVFDATFMSHKALLGFLQQQVQDAKEQGIMFSVHMKATMMKVSDPIIFGHAVRTYFATVFEKHGSVLDECGVNANDGVAALLSKIETLPQDQKAAIEQDIAACTESQAPLAMVDSDRGITNLHVPSDVIIDASMPAMIRSSGQMYNAAGKTQDAKAVIPDSSYAAVYQTVIDDCRSNGAFDPTTMGSVPNVGLMAKKAEEYGSHDKTFELDEAGSVRVVDDTGQTLLEHSVEAGDIWRACQTKDEAIADWVKLAVNRARDTGSVTVFWLDETRAHDAELITKVKIYLAEHDTQGLDIRILDPVAATKLSVERIRQGLDTISVTGNVLRDYLTDLFPILEVGTSAKMLSIVPLMSGGGLFETGAGGSAPKHVQQFVKENHLRWDSLGEFMAMVASLEHVASRYDLPKVRVMAKALDQATTQLLLNRKSPSRKVGELDNRGSHFYLALYWAQALTQQQDDQELSRRFAPVAEKLAEAEARIVDELDQAQGKPVELEGYFYPLKERVAAAMRPSKTFNDIIASI